MYISRVYLDERKHDTARAMYNLEILHGAIEQCFHGDRQHPLWRIDQSGEKFFIIMVSNDSPDFTVFSEQFGAEGTPPQVKNYDLFLQKGFREGDILRFHLTVNPTIKKDNKRIPLNMNKTEKQAYCAMDWLGDRLRANGAELVSAQNSAYGHRKIMGKDKKITLVTATFDGSLKVMDMGKFSKALISGIGHGKAYGCGLISVMH